MLPYELKLEFLILICQELSTITSCRDRIIQLFDLRSFKSLILLTGNLQDCLYLPAVPKINLWGCDLGVQI